MPSPSNKDWSDLIDQDGDQADWLTTYADLVTLLLVFFVLLFSVSSLDIQKFQKILASIQFNLGQGTAVVTVSQPVVDLEPMKFDQGPVEYIPYGPPDEIDENLKAEVKEFAQQKKVGENILVVEEKNRITITIEGQVFFDSGSAALLPGAFSILDQISLIIQKFPLYRVNIKGHTDNVPIATIQFPSNWELSAVRAATVLRYLVGSGTDPRRLTATGYGELLPVAPNDNPENKAKNRRVEFVLEKEKEPGK
ncbi:MAG: OmpA family protein [Pseudomonadota bacterium]